MTNVILLEHECAHEAVVKKHKVTKLVVFSGSEQWSGA